MHGRASPYQPKRAWPWAFSFLQLRRPEFPGPYRCGGNCRPYRAGLTTSAFFEAMAAKTSCFSRSGTWK